MRQDAASRKTAKFLFTEAVPWAAPRKGRRPGYVLYAPWRGLRERPWSDALLLRGIVMADQDNPDFPLPQPLWAQITQKLALPPQQLRIVELILCNFGDKQIADDMQLKVPTIREYVRRIHGRLGVHDRQELILRIFAMSHGIHRQR